MKLKAFLRIFLYISSLVLVHFVTKSFYVSKELVSPQNLSIEPQFDSIDIKKYIVKWRGVSSLNEGDFFPGKHRESRYIKRFKVLSKGMTTNEKAGVQDEFYQILDRLKQKEYRIWRFNGNGQVLIVDQFVKFKLNGSEEHIDQYYYLELP